MPIEQAIALGLVPDTIQQKTGGFGGFGQATVPVASSSVFGSRLTPTTLASAQKLKESEMGMNKLIAVQNLKNQGTATVADKKIEEANAEKMAPLTPETRAKLKAKGYTFPPEQESVPYSTLNTALKADANGIKIGASDDKMWMQVTRQTDPSIALRGSLLGIVGQNNARANRALIVLQNPKATPQDISFAVTDLAGIMQGGAPHESQMKQQNYGTLISDLAKWKQYLSNNPTAASNPEIRKKLMQTVSDIKAIDNRVIGDHLNAFELSMRGFLSKDPQKWLDYKNRIMNNAQDTHVTAQDRYNELKKLGLTNEDAIYKQIAKEGLH